MKGTEDLQPAPYTFSLRPDALIYHAMLHMQGLANNATRGTQILMIRAGKIKRLGLESVTTYLDSIVNQECYWVFSSHVLSLVLVKNNHFAGKEMHM